MSELSTLINRIWVSKNDPDFYEIKSYVRKNREELSEHLKRFGWQIITEPNIVYIKKYYDDSDELMDQGIPGFKAKLDYLNLMIIFMYMTRPSSNMIFTLEELIEYMKIIIAEEQIETDPKSKHFCYSLYRVLTYMEELHLIERMDGKITDLLEGGQQVPGVLYKDLGLCPYFLGKERLDLSANLEQKLYQKLFSKTLVSLTEKEYLYIKNHIGKIEEDFKLVSDEEIELVFGRTYAYINHKEGFYFPNENNKKDWMLLRVCKKIKETGQTVISLNLFSRLLEEVRMEDSIYWTQEMVHWGKRSYESYCFLNLKKKNFIESRGDNLYVHPALFEMEL